MTTRRRQAPTNDDSSLRLAWFAILASTIGLAVSLAVSTLLSNAPGPGVGLLLAGVLALLLLATFQIANRTVFRQVRIALIGAPGVGKTVYVTSLFDVLQTARYSPFRFAPSSETIDRVLATLGGYARGQWATRTPSDFLYLYTARLAVARPQLLRRLFGSTEYELQLADAAGEQLGEFVPGESRWTTKTSYYQYAVDSHVLFLFIDYPTLAQMKPEQAKRSLVDQVNDLIFVIQDICEANDVGPSRQLESPVAVIISKVDLARDPQPSEELSERLVEESTDLKRLLAVARSRCRWVEIFAVSATGPLPDPEIPPAKLQPMNVDAPLMWALEAQYGLK